MLQNYTEDQLNGSREKGRSITKSKEERNIICTTKNKKKDEPDCSRLAQELHSERFFEGKRRKARGEGNARKKTQQLVNGLKQ